MSHHEDHLSTRDYQLLCRFIYDTAGIRLGPEKKTMLELRVKRRLRALHCLSYGDYCARLLAGEAGGEVIHFLDVVTTNKTDFFREPAHFAFLAERGLDEMSARGARPLLIWSAGCSSGEEPYTLAMLLSDYAAAHPGFAFSILATDLSTTVLDKAVRAIYPGPAVEPVPAPLRRRYLLRSRDRHSTDVRIVPELRRLVDFRRLNFMDEPYFPDEARVQADAIFCRNVLIYFDRPTQERILARLIRHLVPDGFLFVGHSETLHDMNLPVVPVAPAIYRKTRHAA